MGTPHKHRDVIIAWAEGEEIEWKYQTSERWFSLCGDSPDWGSSDCNFRIKPKLVKREGWVNVYGEFISGGAIHPTKELAIARASCPITATVRIEWEEEV